MAPAEPDPVCLIHIGKTGGTYVQEVIRASQAPGSGGVHLPGHIPLKQAIADYGAGLRFGFVFRDPLARFTSGFYSRLRMGRPQRQVIWNAGEAAAFSYFTSATDLAEALDSTDARQQSAAVFSLRAIRHLKRGYGYHFGTPKAFLAEVPDRLAACVDIAHLDARLEAFLAHLGVAKVVLP
ncbi:MAG TPA: hypothetical protein VLA45_02145, partial [Paracoccaceae bacterium]|nr:hypothetical protein [Paracoccaceae bacterium]